jgi:hypothetical protein
MPHRPLTRRFAPPTPARGEGRLAAGHACPLTKGERLSFAVKAHDWEGSEYDSIPGQVAVRHILTSLELAACSPLPSGEGGAQRRVRAYKLIEKAHPLTPTPLPEGEGSPEFAA